MRTSQTKPLAVQAVLLLLLLCIVPSYLWAATAQVPDENRHKYRRIKEEIRTQKEKLEEAEVKENTTLNDIDRANRKLQKVQQTLREYRRLLDRTRLDIEKSKLEIADLEKSIHQRRTWLRKKLISMQRLGTGGDRVLKALTGENIETVIRRWKYLEVLSIEESRMVQKYKDDLAELKVKKKKLDTLYVKYRDQEKNVLTTQKSLERERKQKELILASVKKEKSTHERLILELRKTSARLQKIIRMSEQERSRTFKDSGFRNYRGKLSWPVVGKVSIPFGSKGDSDHDTLVFHSGIYIEAPDGTVVSGIHNGKVVFADWFEGYGLLVIINHGRGYHSLYGNLSEIFLSTGDIIDKDDSVGRIGSSGVTERPSLYFEIRYKGKPLDPARWLKP